MRVVLCEAFGPVENLKVVEEASVPLKPGQARLSMRASGLSFVDGLTVQGKYQIRPPLPFRPGGEAFGVVSEVASDVNSDLVGQRCLASTGMSGAWATEVVVSASRLIAIPANVSDGQAATFHQSYLTSWFALRQRITVREGEHMLVLGAGSGVGLAAVDIGRALGMRVIAAASSQEKRDAAMAAGAFATIDTRTEDVKEQAKALSGGGVDVVYDPIGGDLAEPCLRALREEGRYLVVGFAAGAIPSFAINQVLLRNRTVVGVEMGGWGIRFPDESRALTQEVLDRIASGELRPVEPRLFPLDRVADALRIIGERGVTGKFALVP
jgi:NADPH:quinone reductase